LEWRQRPQAPPARLLARPAGSARRLRILRGGMDAIEALAKQGQNICGDIAAFLES
jgi:hypothetical protein